MKTKEKVHRSPRFKVCVVHQMGSLNCLGKGTYVGARKLGAYQREDSDRSTVVNCYYAHERGDPGLFGL